MTLAKIYDIQPTKGRKYDKACERVARGLRDYQPSAEDDAAALRLHGRKVPSVARQVRESVHCEGPKAEDEQVNGTICEKWQLGCCKMAQQCE